MTNFSNALGVISTQRKVIFKVPAGTVIVFPEGVTISPYGQNNDEPTFIVKNHVDGEGTWQGADSENGVVIMNAVEPEIAEELLDMFEKDSTIEGLQAVIARAEELGQLDNYTTTVEFVETSLSPAGRMLNNFTGVVKRDARDICLVVRDVAGKIWRKLHNDAVNHIDTDEILVRDYRLVDGSMIDPASIPVVVE